MTSSMTPVSVYDQPDVVPLADSLPLKVKLTGAHAFERNVRVPEAPPVAMVTRAPEEPHGCEGIAHELSTHSLGAPPAADDADAAAVRDAAAVSDAAAVRDAAAEGDADARIMLNMGPST